MRKEIAAVLVKSRDEEEEIRSATSQRRFREEGDRRRGNRFQVSSLIKVEHRSSTARVTAVDLQ